MDMIRGSEKMLRAHLRNNAQEKNLEDTISTYNKNCRKKTNRVQQQILNIYHDELQPLEQARHLTRRRKVFDTKRRGLPRLQQDNRYNHFTEHSALRKGQLFNSSNFSSSSPILSASNDANTKLPTIPCREKYSKKLFEEDCKSLSDHWLQSIRKCARKHQAEEERLSVIGKALDV